MSKKTDHTLGLSSLAIHSGETVSSSETPIVLPLTTAVSFEFENVEKMAQVMEDPTKGYIYGRLSNPTISGVETKLSEIEGAEACALFSSGMGAISSTLLTILSNKDAMIAIVPLYGGTWHFLKDIMSKIGIEVKFISIDEIQTLERFVSDKTRVIYFEPVVNPSLRIVDPKKISQVAKKYKLASIADNTFATRYNLSLLDYGIDIVIYSCTKFLCGHSDIVGGAVLCRKEILSQIKYTRALLGTNSNSYEAYFLSRGLKTFIVRMKQHAENALTVAEELVGHPKLSSVLYPGLVSHPDYEISRELFKTGGGMMSVVLKAGLASAVRFVNSLKLCRRAVSLGSVETLVLIPQLSSHWGFSPDELKQAGISDGLVRFSIGLEDAKDIISDIKQALANV